MSEHVIGGYGSANEVGHSGSSTSEESAKRINGKQTIRVHEVVAGKQGFGMTCRELEVRLGVGHGSASGALTRLHRDGWLTRLTERRDRQQVYVDPAWVDGREESPYLPNVAYREGYKTPMPLEATVTEVEVRVEVPVKPDWSDEQIVGAMQKAGIHPGNLERMKNLIGHLPGV